MPIEFISAAAHELKSPIAALSARLQLAQRLMSYQSRSCEERWADVAQTLESALEDCHRLIRLADIVLDTSQIRAGQLRLQLEHCELSQVVRETAERLRNDPSLPKVLIRIEVERTVEGNWDRLRLEQLISNLLGNALKYGSGKPVHIQVQCASLQDAEAVCLRISDQGVGITPENITRIFNCFERGDLDCRFSGNGVGLWLVRKIVEAHNGAIQVHSSPGSGSTFTVTLPCNNTMMELASGMG